MSTFKERINGLRKILRWRYGVVVGGPIARWCRASVNKIPPPAWPDKPTSPLTVVTLCGRAHLPLLQACLRSLVLHWSTLPHLRVVSDGSLVPSELAEALHWWRGALEIQAIEDIPDNHTYAVAPAIRRWAQTEPLGKKLLLLTAIDRFPTLYMDTDILWFADLPPPPNFTGVTITTDQFHAYAPTLPSSVTTALSAPPYLNSGLVLLRAPLDAQTECSELFAGAATAPHPLSEQTILALTARRKGAAWSREQIASDVWDSHRSLPTYPGRPWAARHYTTPVRDLFWRDAWWLLARRKRP